MKKITTMFVVAVLAASFSFGAVADIGVPGTITAYHPTVTESSSDCLISIKADDTIKRVYASCERSQDIHVQLENNTQPTLIDDGWSYGWYEAPYDPVANTSVLQSKQEVSSVERTQPVVQRNRSFCYLVSLAVDSGSLNVVLYCP